MQYNILKFFKGFDVLFERSLTENEYDELREQFTDLSFTHVRKNHYFVTNKHYNQVVTEEMIHDVLSNTTLFKFTVDDTLTLPEDKQVFYIHAYEDEEYTIAGIESKDIIDSGESVEYTCERVMHYFNEKFNIRMATEKELDLSVEEDTPELLKETYFNDDEHYQFIYIDDEDEFMNL